MTLRITGGITLTEGSFGSSTTVTAYINAQALRDAGQTVDGVYEINPSGSNPFNVYCMFDPTPVGVFGSAPTGYNLVGVFNRIDAISPVAAGGTDFNTVEYLNDTLWAELQTTLNDTEVYFVYYDASLSIINYAKTLVETPGTCQRIQDTLLPNTATGHWLWAWTDPGCDAHGTDYSQTFLNSSNKAGVNNRNTEKYNYFWNGSAWTLPSYAVGTTNVKYLRIFAR